MWATTHPSPIITNIVLINNLIHSMDFLTRSNLLSANRLNIISHGGK